MWKASNADRLCLTQSNRSGAFQFVAQEVPRPFGSARNEAHQLLGAARGRAGPHSAQLVPLTALVRPVVEPAGRCGPSCARRQRAGISAPQRCSRRRGITGCPEGQGGRFPRPLGASPVSSPGPERPHRLADQALRVPSLMTPRADPRGLQSARLARAARRRERLADKSDGLPRVPVRVRYSPATISSPGNCCLS